MKLGIQALRLEAFLRLVLHRLVTMRIRTPMTVAVACLCIVALPAGKSSAMTSSPSERIAFTANGSDGSIFTVNPDGTGLRRLVPNASGPVWSPDRSRLVFSRRVRIGEDSRVDLYTVRPDGSDMRLVVHAGAYPSWSPDGQSIAFLRHGLWTVRLDGSRERQLVKGDTDDPAWSPDGGWIAFTFYARAPYGVWLIHPDGTGVRRLVKDELAAEVAHPAWAPDGQRVTFVGLYEDEGLYIAGVDGRGLRRVATSSRANEWSPVGRRILFTHDHLEREPNGLWTTRPDGRDQTRLALRFSDPDWSPSGRSIAFTGGGRSSS